MDIRIINAIVEAAEKEGGIHRLRIPKKVNRFHDCVMGTGNYYIMIYNDEKDFTKSIVLK